MKNAAIIDYLDKEAVRFKARAIDATYAAINKSPDKRTITELDARLIRDHEIRSQTFKDAARIVAGHN